MPRRIEPTRWKRYANLRKTGFSQAEAARRAGISRTAARHYDKGFETSSGATLKKLKEMGEVQGVIPYDKLIPEAQKAWDDFAYFRRRHFGRLSTPWQEETAYRIVDLLKNPEKDFLVENAPPGVGKSTKWHDIAAWVTVRDRAIRGLFGSSTQQLATKYTGRLRRTFERTVPMKARSDELGLGLAVDAESTLIVDFGRFRPDHQDLWRLEEFVVEQQDGTPIEEKESSWTSFGMDSGQLGNRYNIIIWDDLVTMRTLRTIEARERLIEWWDAEGETRLEPGGLLILQGQRMGSEDLYAYCLSKTADIGESLDELEGLLQPRMYHHVIYKAHDEENCQSNHSTDSPYQGQEGGCLLDPKRLTWKELSRIQNNNTSRYRVLYQQEDIDPASVLVNPLWVSGGLGVDGVDYPGCWDNDRDLCELPNGLTKPLISYATVDPSPTKMWAVQWWIYHPASDQRFLMDLERKAMTADEFLDYRANESVFYGVMHDWQVRSVSLGLPITHWIVENNAAQRFLLAYDHVKRWRSKFKVNIIPHSTTVRKLDESYGPQILAPLYRFGLIRLPGKQSTEARVKSLKLVDEVTRWPEGKSDDEVMAQWFGEVHIAKLSVQNTKSPKRKVSMMAGKRVA